MNRGGWQTGDEAKLNTFWHKCLRRLLKSIGSCECQMKRCARELKWKLSLNKLGEGGGHGLDTYCEWIQFPPTSCNDVGSDNKTEERKTQRNIA